MAKVGKIKYSEPKGYFPKEIEEKYFGNDSAKKKPDQKKPATKKPTKKKK